MIPLGLSATDRREFEDTLLTSHQMRSTIEILDRNEDHISAFRGNDILVSGAVQIDVDQAVKRSCDLTILKPRTGAGNWIPNAPSDASLFADNFVRCYRGVYVPTLSAGPGWVDVPVFTGPVTSLDEDGSQINVHASGKESLALDPHFLWNPITLNKGLTRAQALQRLMGAVGEQHMVFPEVRMKLGVDLSLVRHTQPWNRAQWIAKGANHQFFYDGRGDLRYRVYPVNAAYTCRPSGGILSKPKKHFNIEGVRNVIEVLGPTPKGAAKRLRAVAQAPAWHPLSPQSLSRNGKPRYMVEVMETDASTSKAVQDLADRTLENRLTMVVSVEFDHLVVPHLEEYDKITVEVSGESVVFPMRQWTIPLTAAETMTVGGNKRVSWKKRRR